MRRRHNTFADTEPPIGMRVPFSLLFLGWWMSRQCCMVTGQDPYFKPSVSVSPKVVTLGGNVTVQCSRARYTQAEFVLYKRNSHWTTLSSKVATGYGVEFVISITDISDAGIYRCAYVLRSPYETRWSSNSDEVHINVTDPSIPKPSIKVRPKGLNAVHSDVSIECQGEGDGLTFYLRNTETGEVWRGEASSTATANFHFRPVKWEHAGSYVCQYHRRSTPFVWSGPSEPVELILEGQDCYSKPSISVNPEVVALGENVTVCCNNARHRQAEFVLYKRNSDWTPLPSKVATGYGVEFIISISNISDAGIYRCAYCFRTASQIRWSSYSDEMHINVTDPSIPKPSIKMKPKGMNAVHSDVSIECQGEGDGLTFSLRKAETTEVLRVEAPSTATANFHFIQVKKKGAGSYVCQYHRRSTPFVWSGPSEPVELILEDSSLPKPSINMTPEGPHDIGVNVTIECKGPEDRLSFSLHKSRNPTALQIKEPEGATATFSLPAVRPEDAGNYTCRCHRRRNRFLYSESSDSVEVTVTGMPKKLHIIWASIAAGLLLVLFLLVLILVLCRKRKNGSTTKERNRPVNMIVEQDAGIDHEDEADHDGITYAVLNIQEPANQQRGPESCVYASVAKGQKQRRPI